MQNLNKQEYIDYEQLLEIEECFSDGINLFDCGLQLESGMEVIALEFAKMPPNSRTLFLSLYSETTRRELLPLINRHIEILSVKKQIEELKKDINLNKINKQKI